MNKKYDLKVIFIISSLILFSAFKTSTAESNINMLTNYFDLVVSGNLESAYYLWTDECRERSARFGIEYTEIPLKVDCNSPIIRNVDLMKDYLQPPVKKEARMPRGFSTMDFSQLVEGNLIEHKYYARNIDNYFWLTYAQQYYALDWSIIESKYFRIRYDSSLSKHLNPISLNEADNYVEQIGKFLGMSNEDFSMISKSKIEYFYCKSDQQVKDITGYLIKGTLDLPSNDIISAFFPHYHELVHLLVNIKLQKLPLYTLPIAREGIAVHLGGRWGKAPNTLAGIGQFLVSQDMITIESILTMNDFNDNAVSDIAYPVAGLFSGYIIEEIGIDNYLDLYLELSGNFNQTMQFSTEQVQTILISKLQIDNWEGVRSGFLTYLDNTVTKHPDMAPGIMSNADIIFQETKFTCTEDKNWYSFEISANAGDTLTGNILFGFDEQLQNYQSELFDEQYKKERLFEGYRFGVRFDQNEVGVYDYATNHLVAKYIFGLQPDDSYYNEKDHKLYFKFKKDVLEYNLKNDHNIKFLSN